MSTVIHPRGPLPRRVYWVRRLLLLALLALIALVIWWVLPSGGSPRAAGQTGRQSASGASSHQHPTGPAATSTAGGQSPAKTTTAKASAGKADGTKGGSHQAGHGHPGSTGPAAGNPTTSGTTTLHPSGRCDVAAVHLAVNAAPIKTGAATAIGVSAWTGNGTACTLGISASSLELRITSGPSIFWQSATCPDELPARNVVVGPTKSTVYTWHWNGRSDDDACGGGSVAAPGTYWVQAALIGGNPAKSPFVVSG